MEINDLLNLSFVPRWVICPRLREQSVGEHSFRVAIIYRELCRRQGNFAMASGLWQSLTHDLDETWTGDIPGFVKKYLDIDTSKIASKPPEVDPLVKVADLIESLTFAQKWIVQPRREFVCGHISDEIQKYCSSKNINLDVVRSIVVDILSDSGRCRYPTWYNIVRRY